MSGFLHPKPNFIYLALLAGGIAPAFPGERTHGQETSGEVGAAPESSAKVKRIALEMRRSLAAIHSIHYTFRQSDRRPSSGQAPDNRPLTNVSTTGEFAYDSGKFLSAFEVLKDGQHSLSARIAFDGHLYQRFDPVVKDLNISTVLPDRPYVGLQPLWVPFGFVKREGDRSDLETVGSEEVWLDFSRKATLAAPLRIGAYDCEVLQYARPVRTGAVQTWEICAAKDLAYFPIRQTARRDGYESVLEIVNFEKFDTAEGTIVIPTEFTTKSWLNGERFVTDERIETTILSVNESIDESMFTLKRDEARVVRFVDVPSEARLRYERSQSSESSWPVGWLLALLGLTATLAFLALIWLRSRRE